MIEYTVVIKEKFGKKEYKILKEDLEDETETIVEFFDKDGAFGFSKSNDEDGLRELITSFFKRRNLTITELYLEER